MKPQYIFPLILIALDLGSAAVNGFHKDWRMMVYWIAAAVLSIAVTFNGKP